MNRSLMAVVWTAVWAVLGMPAVVVAAPARPPNVVFLLCDDLGTGDVGCLGSKAVRTPHIDSLFARGTVLARHWAGSAVCAPSRCVLMTGLHPGHGAVRSNREVKPEGQAPLPPGTVTLAGLFRAAGYATGAFGKWGWGRRAADPSRSTTVSRGSTATTVSARPTPSIPSTCGATASAS